jgi:hypothetical protein
MQLHIQNSQFVNPDAPEVVHGRGLKHRKLTRNAGIDLAADLASGVRPFTPSVAQACALVGVSQRAVAAE